MDPKKAVIFAYCCSTRSAYQCTWDVESRQLARLAMSPRPCSPDSGFCWTTLAGNWPEIAPNTPFLPDVPVANCLKTNHRLLCFLHGMEEVVGSIPTRSTISFDYLQIPLSSLAPHGVRTL